MKRIATLTLFISLMAVTTSFAQDDGKLYTPAYSNPYNSPLSSGATGTSMMTNTTAQSGNGNGNNGNGNGNGGGKNGVPLDTEAWALMLAGAAFGAWTVLKARKNAVLKLHPQQ